jgi:pimeloyl-ACP methyl ester carboxylesterase
MAAIAEMMPPRWFTPDFITREPAAVARVLDMLRGTDPGGYAGCGEAIAGMDLRPALGGIKAPTLVIAGAEDPAAPTRQAPGGTTPTCATRWCPGWTRGTARCPAPRTGPSWASPAAGSAR